MICLAPEETTTTHKTIKPLILLSWSLFEIIQTSFDVCTPFSLFFVFESLWLLYVNFFLQINMQKKSLLYLTTLGVSLP